MQFIFIKVTNKLFFPNYQNFETGQKVNEMIFFSVDFVKAQRQHAS
ncbi:hypothetical protein ROSI111154_02950 [Rouxiella silvae]